jgi:hypothetical protein
MFSNTELSSSEAELSGRPNTAELRSGGRLAVQCTGHSLVVYLSFPSNQAPILLSKQPPKGG